MFCPMGSPSPRTRSRERSPSPSVCTRASGPAPSRRASAVWRTSLSIWCSKVQAELDTRALAEAIEDVGGSLNAWTARDQTVFHGRALGRDTKLVTELIASLVRSPNFDAEHLPSEKQVILSELGEVTDAPDDLVHDHLFEAAFDGQAIGRSILGSEKSVRAIARQDCFESDREAVRAVAAGAGRKRQDRS